jgi:hypothetical protein
MGHAARSSRRESHAAASGGATWRQHVKSGLLLLVAAVSLYLLLPTLASVLASWRSLSHLDWPFAILAVACQAASLVCLWELNRIALGARARFPIACAQLAGNAAGRIVPGAPTPVAVDMPRRAGFDGGRATAANTGLDYLALLCALRSVGAAAPRPSLVLLAYASADLLALVPFTPVA